MELYNNNIQIVRKRLPTRKVDVLSQYFETNMRPNREEKLALAAQLNIPFRSVQIWFQNRRAKAKRQYEDKQLAENNTWQQHSHTTLFFPNNNSLFTMNKRPQFYYLNNTSEYDIYDNKVKSKKMYIFHDCTEDMPYM
ncbi:Homeobox protein HD-10 [Astathelohania contejeani]|uniref:Homeobox protein HD-10 n=1 Tax=Astathelohania contejeani TaxID=164912 RepID=A0ABQ7HY88_9MICR|nr:Homeobox protein HD-10 [Thelohania contejeani]